MRLSVAAASRTVGDSTLLAHAAGQVAHVQYDAAKFAKPKEMGAGIAASPHCAERRIYRCSINLVPPR